MLGKVHVVHCIEEFLLINYQRIEDMDTEKSAQNNSLELSRRSISYDEAERIVVESSRLLAVETIGIDDSLNRILAQEVHSDFDLPPFDKSLVDGYALLRRDINLELEIIETIPAGKIPEKTIGFGQCSRIMTGAFVPARADCVVKFEHTEKMSPHSIRITQKHSQDWIAYRGQDFEKGQRVFEKGEKILPQHIGMLASVGCYKPLVYRRPRVAIIPTGDELVKISTTPAPPHVRGSNGHQLAAQTIMAGGIPKLYPIVRFHAQVSPDLHDAWKIYDVWRIG
jgi:molybdopterin molybdotransferase